jgi:hypothetical protein
MFAIVFDKKISQMENTAREVAAEFSWEDNFL